MIELVVADAVPIVRHAHGRIPALFTSLPDAAEVGGDVASWASWYQAAMASTLASIAPGGAGVIAATDRRTDGATQSKAAVILRAADRLELRILWHKIAVNTHGISLFRPSYSHLIAVANGKGAKPGRATPDVFDAGPKDYPNALGSEAIRVGLDLLERLEPAFVFDPFVGRASILDAAASRGMAGVGIDIDGAQIDAAEHHYAHAVTRLSADDLRARFG